MEARISARTASLQSPRPYSVYASHSPSRLSPKLRDPLLAAKNGRFSAAYRSSSRSPTSTAKERSKRNKSFDSTAILGEGSSPLVGKTASGGALDKLISGISGQPDEDSQGDSPYRRSAMMPVSHSASTWKIVKTSRCLVNPEPLFGVYVNKAGEMYTTSETPKGGHLQCFDRNGNCLTSFYLKPYKNGKTYQPFQVHETPEGQLAIACANCVTVWSKEGKLIMEHGRNMFRFCKNVAVRSTGEIIATDSDSDCVKLISAGGQQITKLECEIDCAAGVAVDSNDNIIVTDWKHTIRIFDTDNKLVRSFGEKGNGDGELDMVYGVTTDCDDNIVVADMWNERVSVFSNEGKFISNVATATSAGIHRPLHIAVTNTASADDNRLAVVEFGGSSIKILSY